MVLRSGGGGVARLVLHVWRWLGAPSARTCVLAAQDGRSAEAPGMPACLPCPAGRARSAPALTCTECRAGYVSSEGRPVCGECSASRRARFALAFAPCRALWVMLLSNTQCVCACRRVSGGLCRFGHRPVQLFCLFCRFAPSSLSFPPLSPSHHTRGVCLPPPCALHPVVRHCTSRLLSAVRQRNRVPPLQPRPLHGPSRGAPMPRSLLTVAHASLVGVLSWLFVLACLCLAQASECQPAPGGYFLPDAGAAAGDLFACPAGTSAAGGATACTPCQVCVRACV